MIGARTQMLGCRPWSDESVFEIEFAEHEIRGGYCQLQLRFDLHEGEAGFTAEWGDGVMEAVFGHQGQAWHNYTRSGRHLVRLGRELRWWRLWECYTVTADGSALVSRPKVTPLAWGDHLESCEGTYCGWNNSDHGGVTGSLIPWGRSLKSTYCCYQFCTDVTGPFPEWTDTIVDATGTFDGCRGMTGRVPRWGRNVERAAQCYRDCPGARGRFPAWPQGCREFSRCFENASGMHGPIPEWPQSAEKLEAVFAGCSGATGTIPKWPDGVTVVRECYRDCAGLTGAWTDDAAELMPEARLNAGGEYGPYSYNDVVTGCAPALRALFRENWGGTRSR